MKRDSLLFRFFTDMPGCFFRLLGRPEDDALRYTFDAIEYKETAVRLDGVFRPRDPSVDPAYIWEAQYYASEKVYANLWTKIGRFLEHGDPRQDWVAVVIYPNRSMEQENLRPVLARIGAVGADLSRRVAAGAARPIRDGYLGADRRSTGRRSGESEVADPAAESLTSACELSTACGTIH